MEHKLDVALIGEALMLLIANQPGPLALVESFSKRTAGAETNVAIGLSRLGFSVGWASRLGNDSMAQYLLSTILAEHIDCSRVVCDPTQQTGFMFKGKVLDGSDPPVEYHRKGSAASHLGAKDIDVLWLQSCRHLHATGIFPALSSDTLAATHRSFDVVRSSGSTISFDPNLRLALWPSVEKMLFEVNTLSARADWLFPGLEEGRMLTGLTAPEEIAIFYRNLGAKLVVIKLGPAGAYFDSPNATGYVAGCPVSKVVDTVGAGDAFAVGAISALLEGKSVNSAVERASWIGARAVEVRGDTEGLPTREFLDSNFHCPVKTF